MNDEETITVVKNDAMPTLYFQLYNLYNTKVLDLAVSTTTITAKFRLKNATSSLFEADCTKVWAGIGIVSMAWPSDSLDITVGRYEIELTVDYNGSPQTCLVIIPIRVKEEFGDVA